MSTLQLDSAALPQLKNWLVKRLEDISDADSDVLADYVIALTSSEDPEDQIRSNAKENLVDFLQDNTNGFVDDVFNAIRTKTYIPGHQAQAPPNRAKLPGLNAVAAFTSAPLHSQVGPPTHDAPSGPMGKQHVTHDQQQQLNGRSGQSKKRTFESIGDPSERDIHSVKNGERAQKQMRRGAATGSSSVGGYQAQPQFQQLLGMQQIPQTPNPPTTFPQFDPNNPMASLLAMQALGFQMPGLDQLVTRVQQPQQQQPRRGRGRCRDYDTKGFCARGSACPYEHGSDHIVVPEEYDPANSSLMLDVHSASKHQAPAFNPLSDPSGFPLPSNTSVSARPYHQRGGRGGRGGARGRDQHQRGARASFSHQGPNSDTRIRSIVIENIPEDSFSDEAVQTFFSEFGNIEDINMQKYRRLAVVRFEDYAAAKKAYESPKVVFDNRFVKVYWYKGDSSQLQESTRKTMNGASTTDTNENDQPAEPAEPQISAEEFAKKQADAQRAHDQKVRKMKEAEKAREELEKKMRLQQEERKKLMERLSAKSKSLGSAPANTPMTASANSGTTMTPPLQKGKTTEALRMKLAELEAEAASIGLTTEEARFATFPPQAHAYAGYISPGRGAFRGRGRGAPRGRGAWHGGSVARLDNRPKTVSLRVLDDGVDLGDEETSEKVRGWLYAIGPFAAIAPPASSSTDEPGRQKETIVTFHERYVAEMFIASTSHTNGAIPGLGKVDLSWATALTASNGVATGHVSDDAKPAADLEMLEANGGEGGEGKKTVEEVDYDVAAEMW